jgi:predicted ribosomally synthesized peptide with SipW-like signal peptide
MLKIIGLLTALVIIIATLSVGTFAYFNDVTTVESNTITAGTLTLTVGDGTPDPIGVGFANMKPTDNGTAVTWAIVNGGTINGDLDIAIGTITNDENTWLSTENISGDTTDNGIGELGGKLKIAIWLDDGDGDLEFGEKYLDGSGTSAASWSGSTITAPTYATAPSIFFTVNSFGGKTFAEVVTGLSGSAGNLKVLYIFPDSLDNSDNQAQSDGVEFDLTFTLTQS